MTTQILYPYIETRSDGIVVISSSGIKVRMLIEAYLMVGFNTLVLHDLYPDLTMGEIHSALAYYWDNKAVIDAQIMKVEAFAENYKQANPSNLSRANLESRIQR